MTHKPGTEWVASDHSCGLWGPRVEATGEPQEGEPKLALYEQVMSVENLEPHSSRVIGPDGEWHLVTLVEPVDGNGRVLIGIEGDIQFNVPQGKKIKTMTPGMSVEEIYEELQQNSMPLHAGSSAIAIRIGEQVLYPRSIVWSPEKNCLMLEV